MAGVLCDGDGLGGIVKRSCPSNAVRSCDRPRALQDIPSPSRRRPVSARADCRERSTAARLDDQAVDKRWRCRAGAASHAKPPTSAAAVRLEAQAERTIAPGVCSLSARALANTRDDDDDDAPQCHSTSRQSASHESKRRRADVSPSTPSIGRAPSPPCTCPATAVRDSVSSTCVEHMFIARSGLGRSS